MLPEEKGISSPDGLENDAQNGINISYSVKDARGCSRFEMRNIKGRQVPLQAIKGSLQAMSKLAFRAQTVDIAYLPLRQGFFGKKRFNECSKGLRFGQQPVLIRHIDSTVGER